MFFLKELGGLSRIGLAALLIIQVGVLLWAEYDWEPVEDKKESKKLISKSKEKRDR